MDSASKGMEFLRQAATMQERGEDTDSEGWLRSDKVATTLGWSDADRATYLGGADTDLMASELGPRGLVQVGLRLGGFGGQAYNYVFGVTEAGFAVVRPVQP